MLYGVEINAHNTLWGGDKTSRMAINHEWEVYGGSTFGSDHYPIICKLNVDVRLSTEERYGRWIFKKTGRDLGK